MKKYTYSILIIFIISLIVISNGVMAENDVKQSDYPEANAVVLNATKNIDYTEKPYEIKVSEKIKLFNKKGIDKFGEVKIRFNKKAENLKIIEAKTVKPNGEIVKAQKDAIHEITPPELSEANIYSNAKIKVINMPALESGAVIKYTYVKKINEPPIKNQFSYTSYLQTTEPIKRSKITVTLPEDKNINYKTKPESLNPKIQENDSTKTYTWEQKNIDAVNKEPSMPPLANMLNYVKFSSIDEWDTINDWYNSLITDQYEINKEIETRVNKLIKNRDSKKAKIAALYNYAAENIRYVGLEYGIGGYKPHKAEKIYKNKYGDCKDKSTLLIAMLKEIDVNVEPVLINSKVDVELEVPTIDSFNHMIVYLPKYDIYLDPTSDVTRFGDIPVADQGKNVFLLDKGKIDKVPVKNALENREEIFQIVDISEDGSAKINIDWQDYGYYDSIYKNLFRQYNDSRRKMVLNQIVNRSFTSAKISNYKMTGVEGLEKSFSMNINLESSNYLQNIGDRYAIKPIKFPLNIHQLGELENRNHPLYLGVKMKFRRKIKINLSDNYKIDFLPDNLSKENSIGNISIDYSKNNDSITVDMNLTIEERKISPEDYNKAQELFNSLKEILQNQIILSKNK